jgi:hypothetical protein
MLTSYELCWNPSLGTWDVKWRVGVECQRRKVLASILTNALVESYEATDIPPAIARKRPESWIPALSITKWLRGSDLN